MPPSAAAGAACTASWTTHAQEQQQSQKQPQSQQPRRKWRFIQGQRQQHGGDPASVPGGSSNNGSKGKTFAAPVLNASPCYVLLHFVLSVFSASAGAKAAFPQQQQRQQKSLWAPFRSKRMNAFVLSRLTVFFLTIR